MAISTSTPTSGTQLRSLPSTTTQSLTSFLLRVALSLTRTREQRITRTQTTCSHVQTLQHFSVLAKRTLCQEVHVKNARLETFDLSFFDIDIDIKFRLHRSRGLSSKLAINWVVPSFLLQRSFLIKRILQAVKRYGCISAFNVFVLNIVPGDPVRVMMGDMADEATVQAGQRRS